jgi:formate dehydrogenase iron-sulfur subunit
MHKTPEGPVVYDSELCIGCRYCLVACPYGIPRYEWEEAVPYVRKCTLCHPRVAEGKEPACVEACPEQALLFGPRDELLAEAHQRIAVAPDRYLPHVWGEREVGGTSVLYLSSASLGFLGWSPELGEEPLPHLSWASLQKVPPVVVGMATLMGGISWVIQRRMRLAARDADGGPVTGAIAPDGHDEDGR